MLIYYSIFILLFSLSLQANDFCNSYSTCFSCNWQFNCEWSSTECKSLNESKRESSWLSSVNLCSNGSNATNQYTIPFTINYFPFLRRKHNSDGTVLLYRTASYDTFHIIYQDVSSVQLLLLSEDSLYANNSNANILAQRYNQSLTFEGKYSAVSRKKIFCVIFFISVSVLSLTSLILFIYFKIIRKKKHIYASTDRSECVVLANKKIIESILPKKSYVDEKEEKCTICCDIIKKGNCVSLLKCNHIFHYQCIYHWCLATVDHPTCPNCKKDLLPHNKNEKLDTPITVNVTGQETV